MHISLLRQVHGPQQEMERLREELIQAHSVNGRLQLQVRCLLRPRHVRHSVRTQCKGILPGAAATTLPRHSNTPAVPAVWHACAGSLMCRQYLEPHGNVRKGSAPLSRELKSAASTGASAQQRGAQASARWREPMRTGCVSDAGESRGGTRRQAAGVCSAYVPEASCLHIQTAPAISSAPTIWKYTSSGQHLLDGAVQAAGVALGGMQSAE